MQHKGQHEHVSFIYIVHRQQIQIEQLDKLNVFPESSQKSDPCLCLGANS